MIVPLNELSLLSVFVSAALSEVPFDELPHPTAIVAVIPATVSNAINFFIFMLIISFMFHTHF